MEAAPGRAEAHVALFATTGKGHLFPLIELARKLLQFHSFAITIIIPDDGSSLQPQKDLLRTVPTANLVILPPISLDDIPESAPIEIPIVLSVTRSIPALRRVLTQLKESARLTAFVADNFGILTIQAVKELGIPVYMLFTSSAMVLSLAFLLPELDQSCTCEYRDLPEPVKLPGCVPLQGSDFFDPVQDRENEVYKLILDMCHIFTQTDGILVNSFLDLERDTFKALEETSRSGIHPPIYPVGPLIRPGSGSGNSVAVPECLKWLDKQPDRSVVYVAFGSGGTLSAVQLKELAAGLGMSEHRFLLVARSPNDLVRNGAYLSGDDELKLDPVEYLPANFMERVKSKKGFVVRHWAPQVEILRHPAVGGFLTHGGWNSTLESIVHGGMPLIVWPLFAEQRMSAVLLSEGLRVAVRVKEDENGVVDGEQIRRLVRSVMEGEKGVDMRNRARDLKEAAARAAREDGSLDKAVAAVAERWK